MAGDVIDVDVVEDDDVLPVPQQTVGQVSIYRSQDPEAQLEEAQARAKVLVQVVREQGLAQSFGGSRKPHVQVEGWTFLASQFGLIPDIEWTRELEDGWEARAQLIRLADGAVVAHAEGECRRSEEKGGKHRWKSANSYEIRSMAQTRAVSKVCRIALSSIMVLAGFSATPAEEMDGIHDNESGPSLTVDDPHCPACLAVNGELVGVWQNDTKPFWRCKNKAGECGGTYENNGKKYVWAGWHESFEASRQEWLDKNPQYAGPQEKVIEGRTDRWGYVLSEIRKVTNQEKDEAKLLAKTALVSAVASDVIDVRAALGVPDDAAIPDDFSDDDLARIATNLEPAEADVVVGEALAMWTDTNADPERPF